MLKHHLLLTFRNARRNKTSFFINLIGLTTGLTCTLLIYLWVVDELSIDGFHKNDPSLYQIGSNYRYTKSTHTNFETDGPLAKELAAVFPEVQFSTTATPIEWFEPFTLSTEAKNIKATGRYASKDFFNVFTYPLIQGNKNEVLVDENSIVISEKLALNIFNTTENVLGKMIEFQHELQFTVSGIFKDLPYQTTEQFDFIIPFKVIQRQYPRFTQWDQRGPATFLVLKDGTSIDQLEQKINQFYQSKSEATNIELFLTRYSERYLYGNYENGLQAGGRIEYVRLFSIIAVFILIIACINFMNLSTARASGRLKEIGIKKSIGSNRKSLILQFMGESLVMVIFSAMIAIGLVFLLLPVFNEVSGKHILLHFDKLLLISLTGIILFTGLVAGSYPALYLTGFNPVAILKGKMKTSNGAIWARKGLVIFQFSISIILIVAVLVVYRQLEFVQTKNIGYDKENVICFDAEGVLAEDTHTFIQEVKRFPGVVNASSSNSRMVGSYGATSGIEWHGKEPNEILSFEIIQVDYDFVETMGIQMAAGRPFSREDNPDRSKVLFNQAAIDAMGLQNPVGQVVKFWGNDAEIIGITKDFHIESFREEVKPMIVDLLPGHTDYVVLRLEAGMERETIELLEKFYKSYNPGFVFDYKFIDENYQALYDSELLVGKLSKYFAGLAILISCLGLFGLAAFTAEQRQKEIGIRKVLGDNEFGIIRLLSKEFSGMVLMAILIGVPVSYLITAQWLKTFAYHIDLAWWFFAGAGLITLLIAWLTVGFQTVKAAMINPARILRSE
ncbi:MAG: ABC transporter permease [Cyclobacteriaceae bacterium]